jgi:hypothetical protein
VCSRSTAGDITLVTPTCPFYYLPANKQASGSPVDGGTQPCHAKPDEYKYNTLVLICQVGEDNYFHKVLFL